MVAILKNFEYLTQLQFDLRYEKIVPNYAPNFFFMVMMSSMTSQVASKFPSIFMFSRGWLREQVARAMCRQQMQIS